jgi:hypothetical protein
VFWPGYRALCPRGGGVTEDTWHEACIKTAGFAISESPAYVTRAADRWGLSAAYGWQRNDGHGIEDFR